MAYFDIKEFKFKIQMKGGGTLQSSYAGSVGFHRPTSEYEAKRQAEEFIQKRYPGCKILDLKITLR